MGAANGDEHAFIRGRPMEDCSLPIVGLIRKIRASSLKNHVSVIRDYPFTNWRNHHMKTRASISILLFGLLLGLLTLCSPLALAQQETATITGEIRDANGSVVPKATITVTNVETNISIKSETNDQGVFTVPSLKPGSYSITVEKTGFKKTVRSGVTLQVNQVAPLDVVMQVGELTTAVEIVEAATLLETETSSRGSVIDQKKIVDLPLNGRDYN